MKKQENNQMTKYKGEINWSTQIDILRKRFQRGKKITYTNTNSSISMAI